MEAVARIVSLQHLNFNFEMTYKGVHLSLMAEGTCPFLQGMRSHITRNYITSESIQTGSNEKRSGLFFDHVKVYSCEICKCYKNRNLEQADIFPFHQWFRSKSREVEQWLRSDTRLAFAGRQPKIERRKCAVHPTSRWQHGSGFRLYRNIKLYLTAICYFFIFPHPCRRLLKLYVYNYNWYNVTSEILLKALKKVTSCTIEGNTATEESPVSFLWWKN